MKKEEQYRAVERKYAKIKRRERRKRYVLRILGLAGIPAVILGLFAFRSLRQPKPEADLPDALRVWFFDAGQGDAALIRTPNHAVLIDAGDCDRGYRIVQKLKSLGVTRLDAAVCSHPHADHIGGMETVLSCIPTDALYMPEIPDAMLPAAPYYTGLLDAAEKHHAALRIPACRDTVDLDGASLTFLSTDNTAFEDLNNCSLGCLVRCGESCFFFAGDLEKEGEEAMLRAGLIPPVSVLKVSHHGSSGSTSEAFLQAAKPEYAVISVGSGNDYGHPAQRTLERLAAVRCEIFRTDLDGTVLFASDGKQLQYRLAGI